jgi:hypothetical protein
MELFLRALEAQSNFPTLNLREMTLGNVEVSTQFLLQNLPPDFL